MSYVVVTGASSGIGEVFARALAAEKRDLIIVARREERLQALASDLRDRFGIKVQVLAADLSQPADVERLAEEISAAEWPLAGLINNAGFGERGPFHQLPLARQQEMVQVNITSLMTLSYRLIPALDQQPGSFIINVASTAAFQPGPNMAVYCASKAFVLSFSEALHEELKGRDIAVSALCPGATETEFADVAGMHSSLLFRVGTMSAEKVVRKALAGRRRALVIPGLINLLMAWSVKVSPRLLVRKIAGALMA